jgi:hypothetical protein
VLKMRFPQVITSWKAVQVDLSQLYVVNTDLHLGYERTITLPPSVSDDSHKGDVPIAQYISHSRLML